MLLVLSGIRKTYLDAFVHSSGRNISMYTVDSSGTMFSRFGPSHLVWLSPLDDHHDYTVRGSFFINTQGIHSKKTKTVVKRKITKRPTMVDTTLNWKLNIEQHEPLGSELMCCGIVFSSLISLRNRYFSELWFLISCHKIGNNPSSELPWGTFQDRFLRVLLPRRHFFHC